jgi:hypothetical protein
MSIYEGLSEPTKDNFLYTNKPLDHHMGSENKILNKETTGLMGLKNSFLEYIAPYNPFHMKQDGSPYGYTSFGVKDGNKYDHLMPYSFRPLKSGYPAHYDPTSEARFEEHKMELYPNPAMNMIMDFTPPQVPYICEVRRKDLKVCKMFNGEKGNCTKQENDFLEQCPNFALRTYRGNKMFNEKAKIIQREEYKSAMKVSDYNKGRSMRDVSKNSSYDMGMASNLRPDSMWADDRYINVTQEDVNKARAKLLEKNGPFDYTNIKGIKHHPVNEVHYSHPKRMY